MNQYLIATIYSLLVFCTFFAYANYSTFTNPYSYAVKKDLIYLIISSIIASIYLYTWTYNHLKSSCNSDFYAINTVKAYSITMLCYIILNLIIFAIIILIKNVLSYNMFYQIAELIHHTYIIFIIFFYIIAFILIFKLANKVNNNFYKIFHYLFLVFLHYLLSFLL